jgi:L-fuconolactonase
MSPRIDAHQHFWSYNERDYVWMTGDLQRLARDFLPEDLRRQLDRVGFHGTVAVQARQMVVETEYLLALAGRHSWILGVVGWVDFASDDLPRQLERYSAYAKLKGVRELIHDMDDPEYAVSDVHLRAIAALADYGLTYDLLLKPPHILPAIRLVDRFPKQRFVVDHIAKPPISTGAMSPWREDIRELARRDNVWCKLSGMVTEADWNAWTPAQIHPYLDVVLEAFGPERVMIGSDWPVCTCAGPYERVMQLVERYIAGFSQQERDGILGGNCARFYELSIE